MGMGKGFTISLHATNISLGKGMEEVGKNSLLEGHSTIWLRYSAAPHHAALHDTLSECCPRVLLLSYNSQGSSSSNASLRPGSECS